MLGRDIKPATLLWLILELIAPLLIVGAVVVWVLDRLAGERYVGHDYRVVIAAAVVAAILVLGIRVRTWLRGARSENVNTAAEK
jgi:hypothetical protein